ncbi:winged helix DNA-binding domain-containing protein [Rothia nasimurium]|uniref:winged helix DNA-binding domain-containing protein n=1 Tax=Rothia nasimurium TaxID=85336 RepID=UPI001F230177|nr:winged helix DNA-binding domain-containing protein [Rothia nasimurium]
MHPNHLLARRLIAQALAPASARPTTPTTITDAAHYMIATQGQNYAGGLTALAIRAGHPEKPLTTNTSHLDTALADYELVRTWSQRGTLHYLHRSDHWVTTLLGPRSVTGKPERLAEQFGLSVEGYEAARVLAESAISEPVSRDQLRALFAEAGYPRELLGHHLRRAGSGGRIIQTRRTGQHDTFVAAEVAIPRQVADAAVRTPAEKTRELTARYFSTRGPASIEDFCWWSTLPKTLATRTVDALVAAGELTGFTLDGTTYYMGSWQADVTPQELDHALSLTYHLPAFDEYFIAYKNRTHLFAPGVDPHTVMTKNGIGWPFTVEGGLITGRA